MHVLVIESNEHLRNVLKHILMAKRHTVETAANPADSLIPLVKSRFDLVIVNQGASGMFDISGSEFSHTIKKISPETTVVITWASERPQNHAADIVLAKPFKPHEFVETIDAVVRNQRPPTP